MRIHGGWYEAEGRIPQPVLIALVQAADGSWINCPFLIDTGANSTVLDAKTIQQLGRPTTPAQTQLGGIGGAVETVTVWTTLRFPLPNGGNANIEGAYSAFEAEGALEMSVLGYDVLHLFALIVDRPGNTVCLLTPPDRYTVQS